MYQKLGDHRRGEVEARAADSAVVGTGHQLAAHAHQLLKKHIHHFKWMGIAVFAYFVVVYVTKESDEASTAQLQERRRQRQERTDGLRRKHQQALNAQGEGDGTAPVRRGSTELDGTPRRRPSVSGLV